MSLLMTRVVDVQGSCGRMGFCRAHLCECVVLYEGRHCEVPREMPDGMHAQFDGNFIFNRARIRDLPDLMVRCEMMRYCACPVV